MLRSVTRRVNKYGVELNNRIYSNPSLGQSNCPVGSRCEVRFHGHKPETVEIFADGTWVCTATVSTAQSKEAKLGVLSRRQAQKREAAERMAKAIYLRVLTEREAQRERGVPEQDLPPLPPDPTDMAEDAVGKPQKARPAANGSQASNTALTRPVSDDEFDAVLTQMTDNIEESA